jgi:hypothetical protein
MPNDKRIPYEETYGDWDMVNLPLGDLVVLGLLAIALTVTFVCEILGWL